VIRDTAKLKEAHYDLIIVGGGINGAATANLAAGCGIQAALFEKGDFASGTSSKSTKLIHGGLRYLENLEFDLVSEALRERSIQLKAAPHLVKPLRFIVPVYKDDRRPLWMMKLGVWLYDFLSGRHRVGQHASLSAAEIQKKAPLIKSEQLLGGVSYFDAQMDDARLCLENILSAGENGAHVYNYMEVVSFIKEMGRVAGVKVRDNIDGKMYNVYAKKIICCGGPWSNELMSMETPSVQTRVRPTKGVHIVYDQVFCDDALLITSKADNRIFFIIPWLGHSLVGTTDTDFSGSPDEVFCEEADIEYLFTEAKRVFPGVHFTREKIISTFAGLRPLAHQSGSPSAVSRKHVFYESYAGVVFVMGGKYTTYRSIAAECLRRVYGKNADVNEDRFHVFGGGVMPPAQELARKYDLSEQTVLYLQGLYGSRTEDVLMPTASDPRLKEPLCDFSCAIAAQAVYAVKVEMAQTIEDVIDRRIPLVYQGRNLIPVKEKIAPFLEELTGKN